MHCRCILSHALHTPVPEMRYHHISRHTQYGIRVHESVWDYVGARQYISGTHALGCLIVLSSHLVTQHAVSELHSHHPSSCAVNRGT